MKSLDEMLKEIEERCEKATPGPWENEDYREPNGNNWRSVGLIWSKNMGAYHPGTPVCKVDCEKLHAASESGKIKEFEANAEFIAHSRTDIPRLVAALRLARSAARGMHAEACASRDVCGADEKLDAELARLLAGEGGGEK